jgi:FlaG/FlaF family flagellin (archaellin)
MKANRKFKQAEDDAVSAVIGVILMVAITVAIAATVYVYVSGMIGTSPQSTPEITFTKDEAKDRLIIAKSDGVTQWDDIAFKSDAAVTIVINGEANASSTGALTQNVQYIPVAGAMGVGSITDTITAGSYIDFEGTSAAITTVTTINVISTQTNSVIGTYEFSTISQLAT